MYAHTMSRISEPRKQAFGPKSCRIQGSAVLASLENTGFQPMDMHMG